MYLFIATLIIMCLESPHKGVCVCVAGVPQAQIIESHRRSIDPIRRSYSLVGSHQHGWPEQRQLL